MEDNKGLQIIRCFAEIAPYINKATASDMAVTVYEGDTCIVYAPGDKIDLNEKVGHKLVYGLIAEKAFREKVRVVKELSKEESIYGIPYIATAIPILENDGTVAGIIATTESTEVQNFIRFTADNLHSSSSHLASAIQDLSAQAEKLAVAGKVLEEIAALTVNKVKDTDNIVAFINDVASRTNLLGLNAAIEAARVGDMGKGFGVVAGEVRKLAVNSAESAKQINEVLQVIKESNTTLAKQSKDVENSVQNQAAVVQEIASASEELAAMAQELQNFANKNV